MTWEKTLPVIVSIGIIISVAILREYSRAFAAIAATMPINIPLGMWIIYAGAEDKQKTLFEFNQAVAINMIPTLVFVFITWQVLRQGWGILPTIGAGYLGWAITLGLSFWMRGLT
jgi:hypothetical protein